VADLKGKEKALIFLSSLGDEVSKKVLNCLSEKMSTKISAELNNFKNPGPEAIAYVFKELAKFALVRQKEAQRIAAPIVSTASVDHLDSLSQLGRKTPRELVALLQNEEAQTIAFILSFFSKTLQASFYEILSPGRRNEIKNTLVEKIPLANEVFEKINEKLLEQAA